MFAGTVILAALFFTVGGVFMKFSEGLTKFWPTVIVFALFLVGAALQTLAMKREDLAVTYLLVVGLESILAFLFGVLLFSESCTPVRIAGVLLITGGIVSLRSAL
ncbi:DMT family transporter [Methyloceanibacter sp.]|uniref:DMT family transporter n=1 Tax=Methyloceanibacter sp. TaxID=1965321 RepID=UPI003D6CDB58